RDVGGEPRGRVEKLAGTCGTAVPDWHPDASGQVSALVVSGGDLYAGGAFTTIGGQPRNRIARLPTSSAAPPVVPDSWDPDASNAVSALAVSGSSVYAGGSFSAIGGQSRNFVAKLSTSVPADADFAWNPGANSVVRALALSA